LVGEKEEKARRSSTQKRLKRKAAEMRSLGGSYVIGLP
jgi:hypothetical protein